MKQRTEMKVKEFIAFLRERIDGEVFYKVCKLAKDGKMGFGRSSADWGSADGSMG